MRIRFPKKWRGRHLAGLLCLALGTALIMVPGGGWVAAAILYGTGCSLVFT